MDTSRVIAQTAAEYVSFNLDSSANRDFFHRDLDIPAYADFAALLQPSFLRVGGTGANALFYQIGTDEDRIVPPNAYNWSKPQKGGAGKLKFFIPTYLNTTQWDSVNRMAMRAGSRLVFNMNYLQFMVDGGRNLRNLLTYSIAHNYSIFVIKPANEIMTPSPEMLRKLQQLLVDTYPDENSRPVVIGPDQGNPKNLAGMYKNAKTAGVPLYAVHTTHTPMTCHQRPS